MKLTVVVDGGGTGCRLAAYDEQGELRARAMGGPAQLSLGVVAAWDNVSKGICSVASQLGLPADWMPHALCLGLAGALHNERRRHFRQLIPAHIDTRIVTDGHAQLLGACGGQAGVCLSVGTGSVLHWLDEKADYGMAGGWGFPAGDQGAGAWLGVQLLIRYCHYLDSCTAGAAAGKESNLPPGSESSSMPEIFQRLQERIGMTVTEVQHWTTCKNPTELASLVPLVVEALHERDETACSLLNDGVAHCVELLALAPPDLPVFIVGGLSETYQPLLAMQDAFRDRLALPAADALAGLYTLSKSSDAGLPDH